MTKLIKYCSSVVSLALAAIGWKSWFSLIDTETPGNGLEHWPSGGCSMSPFLSQVPIGWISAESISLQKSLVLSLPSRRSRRRIPIMPITVAMQTELELRGSRASSFIPALNSFEGGTLDCRGTHGRHRKQEMFSHRSTQDRQKKNVKMIKQC